MAPHTMNTLQERPNPPQTRREVFLAWCALSALGLICVLALFPPETVLADRVALLGVGIVSAIVCWTPFSRWFLASAERTAFALTAAFFLIYGLARLAGPNDGFALRFSALPDDTYVVPYSAYIVVLGALITAPSWLFSRLDWTRAAFGAVLIISVLTVVSLLLLGQHYPIGPAKILDPFPIPSLAMLFVEYSCVLLLCHTVAAAHTTRRFAIRVLPGVLLLLWARYQFFMNLEDE